MIPMRCTCSHFTSHCHLKMRNDRLHVKYDRQNLTKQFDKTKFDKTLLFARNILQQSVC